MVKTVFLKSIVFFVSLGFENFYEFFECWFFTPTQSFKYHTYAVLVNFLLRIFWAICQETCKAWAWEINLR